MNKIRGIVTAGEGRYEASIVLQVRLLREVVGCTLPITVVHHSAWRTPMAGWDVNMVDSSKVTELCAGYASKSWAVLVSGYDRVLWLDADAYVVADPTPLFDVAEEYGLCVWEDWACTVTPTERKFLGIYNKPVVHHTNGGQWLFNRDRWLKQMQAIRMLDNHYNIWYPHTRCTDECSMRMVRSLIEDKDVKRMGFVRRTRGIGILTGIDGQEAALAHRMRPDSKFILGTVPRRCEWWPHEKQLFDWFQELDPAYQQHRVEEAYARSPQGRRAARHKLLKR